jgi:long-chain acyl-CoA synthetase
MGAMRDLAYGGMAALPPEGSGATLAPDEIIAFCRERLAAYKVPRLIEFRDAIPKTGVGKYLRRALRES